MAFCSPQELVNAARLGLGIATYAKQPYHYSEVPVYQAIRHTGPLDLKAAKNIIKTCKQATKEHRQAKINRPYILVPLTDNLDPEQSWIGWEIECGWEDQASYDRVIDYIWRYQNHVTVDIEGAGLPTEITFPPENANKMWNGTAQVQRFLNWVEKNRERVTPARWNSNSHVGTHLNVSTPAYRHALDSVRSNVVRLMNTSLEALSPVDMSRYFGRSSPYGYGFRQQAGNNHWIEYKLFNSTIVPHRFAEYVRVAKIMSECIEELASGRVSEISPTDEDLPEDIREHLNNLHLDGIRSQYYSARIINFSEIMSGELAPENMLVCRIPRLANSHKLSLMELQQRRRERAALATAQE